MEEIWKTVTLSGYEHYEISNLGNVKKNKFVFINKAGTKQTIKEIIPKFSNSFGYNVLRLTNGKTKINYMVHRLVALAFIPNPENKPHINHKNSIRNDNRVENLEWCTPKENAQHKIKQGYKQKGVSQPYEKNPNAKPIVQLSLNGDFIKEYSCVKYACELGNFNNCCISMCCSGKLKQHRGYKWKYKKDYTAVDFKENEFIKLKDDNDTL